MAIQPLKDERIRRVLSLTARDDDWRGDLLRLQRGDTTLTRASAGEASIKAVQRLLIFLGYSTAASGAFLIDGDFGRGTNRGVAQFQFDHKVGKKITRAQLCYDCSFQTARKRIVAIPDTRLDIPTLKAMLGAALQAIEGGQVTFGNFEDALFHLNSLHRRQYLDCRGILKRYGAAADAAVATMQQERGIAMRKEWILSIIRQESAGVVRPRFEQHWLSKLNTRNPRAELADLRIRAMSMGLGQVMGFNHESVGAPSARSMLVSPVAEQVLFVARFIAAKKSVVVKKSPTMDDFRTLARYYNGPAYEAHFYHERLQSWFREFRSLIG